MAKKDVLLEEIYIILQETASKIGETLSISKEVFCKYNEVEFQDFLETTSLLYLKDISKRLTGKGIGQRKALCARITEECNIKFNKKNKSVNEKVVNIDEPKNTSDAIKNVDTAIELVKPILDKIKSENLIDSSTLIRVSNEFDLYDNMPISSYDSFDIKRKSNVELSKMLAIVVRTDNTLDIPVAVGKLENYNENYKFTALEKNIDYDLFKNKKKFKVYLFNKNCEQYIKNAFNGDVSEFRGTVYSTDIQITFKNVRKETRPLCIDFGTSNTTAGSYGLLNPNDDKLEFVEFETGMLSETSKLYPTMVYVKKCPVNINEPVSYMFGYEAKNKVVECKYDTEATVFFEIKRWITSLDNEEEIQDEEGCSRKVKRREIIEAYLLDVINKAEVFFKVRFKKIHFSAPVKLKSVFIKELNQIFKDKYDIYGMNNSLDEGKAIVYKYIQEEINRALSLDKNESSKQPETNGKMLILDCGGGTTDLASCEYDFNVNNDEVFTSLKISTQFENGNANFGGNNITYRILQLLKIKMAKAFYPDEFEEDVNKLIPYTEEQILDVVDENAKNRNYPIIGDIYINFEKEYEKAEEKLPTRFADSNYYKKESKRNYYYLWQLAESIKIEFYRRSTMATYNFEKNITAEKMDGFYLYRYDENSEEIVKNNDIPNIELTNNEIKKIIYADIYSVMHDLFSNLNLLEFNRFKLSGQSCKITLFQELLKEFITGQMLRKTNISNDGDSENLKLGCIKGCITYRKAVDRSEISPSETPSNKIAKPIYNIRCELSDGFMYDSVKQISKILPVTVKFDSVIMLIENQQGGLMRRVEFRPDKGKEKQVTIDDLRNMFTEYSNVSTTELDEIIKGIEEHDFLKSNKNGTIILVIPSKDGYGFNIYQIRKDEKNGKYNYHIPNSNKPKYENYEDVTVSFFDGKK